MSETRNTFQKQLIRDTVMSMHEHPTADDVYDAIKEKCPTISRATVYRVLNNLANEAQVRRVSLPSAADRYDFTLKNHYHIKCTVCGKIDDSFFPYKDDIGIDIKDNNGYKITGHTIMFEGICPQCLSKQNNLYITKENYNEFERNKNRS